jgi:hypothetical protein
VASLAFFGSEVCARRIKIGSLGTGHILPRVAKAKGRGIMDMRTLLLATRPQRQGLLQAGAMAMAATHEQAINQSWAQVRESTAQAQCPTDATVISPGKKIKRKREKRSLFSLQHLTCCATGGEAQHLRSAGAGGGGGRSKKRARRRRRRRRCPFRRTKEPISACFHCGRRCAGWLRGIGSGGFLGEQIHSG